MADVIDLLKFADETKPVEFADSFNQLMGQKVLDALSAAKQGIASSVFNGITDDTQESEADNGDSHEDS